MGDVQDILALRENVRSLEPKKTLKRKRPEGMSREVFSLVGTTGDLTSVMPTKHRRLSVAGLKDKRQINRNKVNWVCKPFNNPARTDGLTLNHWIKSEEKIEDYPFAKYDKKLDFLIYTEEEYKEYFESDSWTKEQTDTLFDLCKRFDQRFIIIADRFPQKKIENIKERFFTITKKLIELRKPKDYAKDPVYKYNYDASYDMRRKTQFEFFYNRTTSQRDEELELISELKRIELYNDKHKTNNKLVQDLLKSAPTPFFSSTKRPSRIQKLSKHDVSSTPQRFKKSGAYSRNSSILSTSTVNAHKVKKVELLLQELGVGKPLPTAKVVHRFNSLRQELVVLLDLVGHLQKREYDVKMLRARKHELEMVLGREDKDK